MPLPSPSPVPSSCPLKRPRTPRPLDQRPGARLAMVLLTPLAAGFRQQIWASGHAHRSDNLRVLEDADEGSAASALHHPGGGAGHGALPSPWCIAHTETSVLNGALPTFFQPLHFAAGPDTTCAKDAPMCEKEAPTINAVRRTFDRMGFDDQETVALIVLGHQYGRCHPDISGYEGPWYVRVLYSSVRVLYEHTHTCNIFLNVCTCNHPGLCAHVHGWRIRFNS